VSNRASALPLQALTVYLLTGCKEAQDAILPRTDLVTHYIDGVGALLVKPPKKRSPTWANFFAPRVAIEEFGKASSPAAVLLVTIDARHFALTFGSGRYLIDPLKIEQRFGLRVAINAVDSEKIRSLDKLSFDRLASQSRIQASRNAKPSEFGLDIEQDLLRAVTGSPRNGKPGEVISGLDALHVIARISIDDLRGKLEKYVAMADRKSYPKEFKWLDNIEQERQQSTLDALNSALIDGLRADPPERWWLAPQDIVDWHTIAYFQFGHAHSSPRHTELSLSMLIDYIGTDELSFEKLSHTHIVALRADDSTAHQWLASRCIYAEIDRGARTHILNGGTWYSIARAFIDTVNEAVEKIPIMALGVPKYEHESEGEYNSDIANKDPTRFDLLDKNLAQHGGGHSAIEFCDLYSASKQIIHVKRAGGSSVLSHLFSQALVSGELFRTDPDFRKKVNEKLSRGNRLADPAAELPASEFTVVLAIVGGGGATKQLPFFSKVNLKNTYRRLTGFGFNVAISYIPVAEGHQKKISIRNKKRAPGMNPIHVKLARAAAARTSKTRAKVGRA
jgi:uncharacterized protein (TIGR04141 family)